MSDGARASPPAVVRRLDTPGAVRLARLAATFEDLQTVLRSCEHLVSALAAPEGERDDLVIESVWTVALLSYARCFADPGADPVLSESDLGEAVSSTEAVDWHRVLLQLRDHHADPVDNPREQFSVGVAQDPDGSAEGIAITSARQPLVDDITVRQTGAIAFGLSGLVNDRIAAAQPRVFDEVKNIPTEELAELGTLEITQPD